MAASHLSENFIFFGEDSDQMFQVLWIQLCTMTAELNELLNNTFGTLVHLVLLLTINIHTCAIIWIFCGSLYFLCVVLLIMKWLCIFRVDKVVYRFDTGPFIYLSTNLFYGNVNEWCLYISHLLKNIILTLTLSFHNCKISCCTEKKMPKGWCGGQTQKTWPLVWPLAVNSHWFRQLVQSWRGGVGGREWRQGAGRFLNRWHNMDWPKGGRNSTIWSQICV